MANHYSGKRAAGRKPVGKRALSLLMALVMSLSLVQITAFAVEETQESDRISKQGKQVESTDGLATVEKHVDYVDGDNFNITLTVTVKDGEETSITNKPAHVVLVMDRSNSMKNYSRFGSAREAANTFAETLLKGNVGTNDNGNRIAVVGFGTSADEGTAFSGEVNTVKGWIESATTEYPGEWKKENGQWVWNSKQGGTNIQAGIHEAQAILDADNDTNAAKIIVVFSDGEPTYSFRVVGVGTWEGCTMEKDWWDREYHSWNDGWNGNGHPVQGSLKYSFDYTDRVGSGSSYSYYDDYIRNQYPSHVKYTCEHGETYNAPDADYYKNNGQPTIAEAKLAKDAGTEIYSVYLGGKNTTNAIDTMKGIASDKVKDHFLSTDDMTKLAELFGQIVNKIILDTQAMSVTDPMGDYIKLGDVDALVEAGLITLDEDGNGFTWNVSKSEATINADGSRTYTLTYPITLETSKEGFVDGKAYDTNKTTTLNYTVTKDEKTEDRTLDFDVPQVNGKKPSVDPEPEMITVTVTHNYYKDSVAEGNLESTNTVTDQAEENESYTAKLEKNGYQYVSSTPENYTIDRVTKDNCTIIINYVRETEQPPVEKTYTVTVNYLEQGSNKVLADPYTETHKVGESYNVTAKDAIAIAGYTYVYTEGYLTGTPEVDVDIYVYYNQKDDGPKTEWDIGVAKTATNLDDNYLSNVTLTIETVQKAEPVDPPSGGDDDEEEVVQPGDQDEREETDPDEDEEEAGAGDTDKGGDSETDPVIGGDDNANAAVSVMSTLDDPEESDPIENGDDDEEESQPGQGEKVTVLEAGAYVVDAIGYGTDDKGNAYDFAFVTDAKTLSMELNGTTYPATQVETKAGATASYVFLASVDGENYPIATVDYYVAGVADGVAYDEYFVWSFAEAIMSGDVLKLHYQVKLTDPQTAAGTYGQYDADGSEGYTSLYTNKYANLLDNADHMVAVFPKPTVSYTVKSEPVDPPVGPSYDYYTVTVNYYDKDSGEVIHTAYTTTQREYTAYDVTAQDKIAITGYTYVETTGDALTGTLNGNKVINVYYTKDSNIDDGNTPTDPGTDIGDDDVPVTPAKPPKTGDSMGLWITAAMVSGMGLIWLSLSGKKRKEEI